MFLLAAVPEGRVFGLDEQTLISIVIQLVNACILAAALTYILYKPVRKFLHKRADRIREEAGRAQEDMAKANELKAEYEQKLTDIELERVQVLESAHLLAAEKGKQLLVEAQNEAAAAKERALAEVQVERERVQGEIKLQIIEAASLMAGRFVAHAIDSETQSRLFDETMAELEGSAWKD